MPKISYAGCLGLSPAIWSQFALEMCTMAKNCEKLTKNPYYRGSRSFKVIGVDKSKKPVTAVLVMISSMSVPICDRFHTSLHEPIAAKYVF